MNVQLPKNIVLFYYTIQIKAQQDRSGSSDIPTVKQPLSVSLYRGVHIPSKICIRNDAVKLELIGEKLMKNKLIISSSPRKKGNSQILCEQFKKGAEAKGHQVKIVRIRIME